jgi:hypothetical protein
VNPLDGITQFEPAGMERDVPLVDKIEIPVGSSIDVSQKDAAVALTSEGQRGERQSATLDQGKAKFEVDQDPDRSVTDIRLRGGKQCKATGGRRGQSSRIGDKRSDYRRDRKVRASTRRKHASSSVRKSADGPSSGGNRFRTIGRFSSATVSKSTQDETVWVTQDRCDGTLTRVTSGTVEVHDLIRDQTVTLTAGERYLAGS